jgi:hypothetical protein
MHKFVAIILENSLPKMIIEIEWRIYYNKTNLLMLNSKDSKEGLLQNESKTSSSELEDRV